MAAQIESLPGNHLRILPREGDSHVRNTDSRTTRDRKHVAPTPLRRGPEDEIAFTKTREELRQIAEARAMQRDMITVRGDAIVQLPWMKKVDELTVPRIETKFDFPSDAKFKKGISEYNQVQRYKIARELNYLRHKKKLQKHRQEAIDRVPEPEMITVRGKDIVQLPWMKKVDELTVRRIETKFDFPSDAKFKKGISEYDQVQRYKIAREMKKMRAEKKAVQERAYNDFISERIGINGFNDDGIIFPQMLRMLTENRYFEAHSDLLETGMQREWKVSDNHPLFWEKQRIIGEKLQQDRIVQTKREVIKSLIEQHEKGVWDRFMLRQSLYITLLSGEIVANTIFNKENFQRFSETFTHHPLDWAKGFAFLATLIAGTNAYEWYEDHKKPLSVEKEFAPEKIVIYEAKRELSHQRYIDETRSIVI